MFLSASGRLLTLCYRVPIGGHAIQTLKTEIGSRAMPTELVLRIIRPLPAFTSASLALSLQVGAGAEAGDAASQLMQRFWDSALALPGTEEEEDVGRWVEALNFIGTASLHVDVFTALPRDSSGSRLPAAVRRLLVKCSLVPGKMPPYRCCVLACA